MKTFIPLEIQKRENGDAFVGIPFPVPIACKNGESFEIEYTWQVDTATGIQTLTHVVLTEIPRQSKD